MMPTAQNGRAKAVVRWLLGALYLAAGAAHIASPNLFVSITPGWVPAPEMVVHLTGWAELAGALALLQPWSSGLRRLAGWGLAAYALCVWPANVNHLLIDLAKPGGGWGLVYHVPRLAFQPVLIWAALWCCGAIRRS